MKTLSVAGDRVVILLEGADTEQKYSVMEATVAPGGGPSPHLHHHEDETFLVLAGKLTFYLGDKSFLLEKNNLFLLPEKSAIVSADLCKNKFN